MLAINRLNAIKANHKTIKADYKNLNSPESMAKITETKTYKAMSFEAGCLTSKGHTIFTQKYTTTPNILFSTNGLEVRMDTTQGEIHHVFTPKVNSTGFEVADIYPINKMQQYPVCFLVVPPYA